MERFGHAAALRYETLIDQAIAGLAGDPARPTAKERPDWLRSLWLYHLAFSHEHVQEDQAVKSPRHFRMFRHLQPGIIGVPSENGPDRTLRLEKRPEFAFAEFRCVAPFQPIKE